MKKVFLVAGFYFRVSSLYSQNISVKLQKAYQQFESDSQLRHAISYLYVINAKTGEVVFDKNSQIGLAPASTQKIITAVTAFELLGKDFRYKTELGYDGEIKNRILNGNLYIVGSGDPTLGSWRYNSNKDSFCINEMIAKIKDLGIVQISRNLIIDDSKFNINPIPDGWI